MKNKLCICSLSAEKTEKILQAFSTHNDLSFRMVKNTNRRRDSMMMEMRCEAVFKKKIVLIGKNDNISLPLSYERTQ